MKSIDSVSYLSKEEFHKIYFQENKPVIHKGGAKNAKYVELWSTDYLREKINSRVVKVNFCEEGVYDFNKNAIKQEKLSFDNALTFFCSKDRVSKSYYLQQTSIGEISAELLDDLQLPEWSLASDLMYPPNLWIGGAGCVSPLHYDMAYNFLVQVKGRKELIIFSPEDSMYLYPSGKQGGGHLSDVNLDNIDIHQFPMYTFAQPFHCILEPGDLLFIPPRWWHHVRSLDMCISVNHWWERFDLVEGIGIDTADVSQVTHLIKQFLDAGADINHSVMDGEPILLKAIKLKYANVVEALLLLGANANVVSSIYSPGSSALLLAIESGSKEIVKLLTTYGTYDKLNISSALNLAIKTKNIEIVDLLNS
jgi:tRNA wybutosine-synthesizing protein 5